MSRNSGDYYGFRPYVSVAERRRNVERQMAKLAKKGKTIKPVRLDGRTIARTFWGKAWCDNLESYMDYANRLPRGRTYVRNGSVVHLDIHPGVIEATISGSELYQVTIQIAAAAKSQWKKLCHECGGAIGSLVELLQGRFSDHVMGILTRKDTGLFPSPKEIHLKCSCPDSATMCKHVAAVLYGVGARLDESPEMLFTLRSVNHEELITQAASATDLATATSAAGSELAESELSDVFGIGIVSSSSILARFLMNGIPTLSQLGEHGHDAHPFRFRFRYRLRPRFRANSFSPKTPH
jgi:uncharacterized Zn finger protein